MIKAIIFDCFGVLTTDHWRAFVDGLPESADAEKARELNHQYDAGLISREVFLAQVEEVTGHTPKEVESLLWDEIVKNTPLLRYIGKLRDQGYKIGLLSNVATPWIRDTFLTEDEQKLFDAMIFSFEVGMTKPDPRIFRLACERLDVEPKEAVLVDDIDRYCAVARDEGLRAVVYKDMAQLKAELASVLDPQDALSHS